MKSRELDLRKIESEAQQKLILNVMESQKKGMRKVIKLQEDMQKQQQALLMANLQQQQQQQMQLFMTMMEKIKKD